jgi:hypothetical protein
MKSLSNTWITDEPIDFEFKKYQLLAWLQNIEKHFTAIKLYPYLGDLVYQFNTLKSLKEKKEFMFNKFPERLVGIDKEKLSLIFETTQSDDVLSEITEILEFSIPKIKTEIDQGAEIYDWADNNLMAEPLGIVPLYRDEGYVFINNQPATTELDIYRYKSTLFTSSTEKYRGISYRFIENRNTSTFESLNAIKQSLAKKFIDLPNPAAYVMWSKLPMPKKETLLPLSKKRLAKLI